MLSAAGRPALGVSLRFGDTATEPETGAEGELFVGSDHLFGGYWNDGEATDSVFTDGYYSPPATWPSCGRTGTWRSSVERKT